MPIIVGVPRVDKPVELVVHVQSGEVGFNVVSNSAQLALICVVCYWFAPLRLDHALEPGRAQGPGLRSIST
jgi:hypothetical protein